MESINRKSQPINCPINQGFWELSTLAVFSLPESSGTPLGHDFERLDHRGI